MSRLKIWQPMQEHIPQWRASRLTQSEYCKAHDIKPHIFSY
ncbi:IS66 family insertion sequence element accessory protein TnpA [Bathymodiolus japonicus methanotrophic gill symbiont]